MEPGDEIGKVVYKVELDTSSLDKTIDYVAQKLNGELPDNKQIKLEIGKDYVADFEQAQAKIEKVSQSILLLTHSLGDLKADASGTGTAIAQMMDQFAQGGGNLDGLIEKLRSMGEAVGVNSNGQLLNGLYELRDQALELTNELSGLTQGTAEYQVKEAEAAQAAIELQNALHSLDSSYKPLYTTVQQYSRSLQQAKQSTADLNSESGRTAQQLPNVARAMGTIMAAWSTLKRSVSIVTNAVSDYLRAQEDIAKENNGQYLSPATEAWNKMKAAIENVKLTLGSIIEAFAPIINWIAEFITKHREAIAAVTAGIAAAMGVIGVVGLVTAAVKAVNTVLAGLSTTTAIATAGISLLVGLLAALGVAATTSASNIDEQTIARNGEIKALKEERSSLEKQISSLKKSANSTAKAANATKDYARQLVKLRRNYLESLKQIEINHNETIASLRNDLEELRMEYENTIAERQAKFDVTAAEEARTHQEMVDELTTQLNFLQRYNNAYNQEKLARVQFALEKEQAMYERETEAREKELEIQNKADEEMYKKRRDELQESLNQEIAFMEKHRQDLYEVREVTLLDEIDQLKRSYAEQEEALRETLNNRAGSISSFGNTVGDTIDDLREKIKKLNKEIAFLQRTPEEVAMDNAAVSFNQAMNPHGKVTMNKDGSVSLSYATGGYTGAGPKYEVAGIVHRGEYVVPQEEVDQDTGTPKFGTTQNITINVQGTFATSSQERRKVAEQIADALAQLNKAGRTTAWQ